MHGHCDNSMSNSFRHPLRNNNEKLHETYSDGRGETEHSIIKTPKKLQLLKESHHLETSLNYPRHYSAQKQNDTSIQVEREIAPSVVSNHASDTFQAMNDPVTGQKMSYLQQRKQELAPKESASALKNQDSFLMLDQDSALNLESIDNGYARAVDNAQPMKANSNIGVSVQSNFGSAMSQKEAPQKAVVRTGLRV